MAPRHILHWVSVAALTSKLMRSINRVLRGILAIFVGCWHPQAFAMGRVASFQRWPEPGWRFQVDFYCLWNVIWRGWSGKGSAVQVSWFSGDATFFTWECWTYRVISATLMVVRVATIIIWEPVQLGWSGSSFRRQPILLLLAKRDGSNSPNGYGLFLKFS